MGRSHAVPRGGPAGEFGPGAEDTDCFMLHVDMDAFFVAVEVRRRPELVGKPVIVGGVGPRGVVSSASYEARAYGVRSAMPGARARQLCPGAVFLPPDFAAYSTASRAIMAIFRDVTPLVEPLSMDEAFLDVSGAVRLFGRPAEIAASIRERVLREQHMTCSVGVAPTMFIAKLGSTMAKPDGLVVVPGDRVLDYLRPLPITAIWGVGERTAEALGRLGLRTVRDVAEAPITMLRSAVGVAAAHHLHELSWGRDGRRVTVEHIEKSVGAETTFETDVTDAGLIRRSLLTLAGKVATRLRRSRQSGRTITIKIRFADFRTINRSRTLVAPTDVAHEIFENSFELFETAWSGDQVRLVGVRVDGLAGVGAPQQLTLDGRAADWQAAERAGDAIAARFGAGLIRPASLLGDDKPRSGGKRGTQALNPDG